MLTESLQGFQAGRAEFYPKMIPHLQVDRVSFDSFEVDRRSEELWRGTRKVRCQRQPFRVLWALLERPGEVVTREELQRAIWGNDSPADADHSLGIAINKIREALGDSADSPRFIETLSRRGYRFLAPVSVVESSAPHGDSAEAEPLTETAAAVPPPPQKSEPASTVAPAAPSPVASRKSLQPVFSRLMVALALCVAAGVLAGLLLARFTLRDASPPRRIDQLTHNDSIFPGVPAMESFPVLASDGGRLYSSLLTNGQTEIASLETGDVDTNLSDSGMGEMQPLELPSEVANPTLADISPDGSRLLVLSHLSSDSEQPVWVVPRGGGSALRVGNILAHDAVWMPDGESVLYAIGNDLNVVRLADGTTRHFASLPGHPFWMRWSPDGALLRLTVLDPLSHTSSLWQIAHNGAPQPLLAGWTTPASECCGVWTSDGDSFVFQSSHQSQASDAQPSRAGARSDLWRMRGKAVSSPEKLTNGPLSFSAPAPERHGSRIYFVGMDVRSELERFEPQSGRFVVETGLLAGAARVSYTRDRQWVAWTDMTGGRLWRARTSASNQSDPRSVGAQKVQLTPDNLQVFLARWAPDGRHLVAMARPPGQSWQLILVSADGGAPERLLHENRNEADPTWSSDGKQIAFGRTPDLMGKEDGPKQIEILNLDTRKVESLPGSEGLFSPRWSPDGRWIAALSLGEQRLMLYDTAAHTWRQLGDLRAADPVWSADSSALYMHTAFDRPQAIERVAIPSGAVTTVATLTNPPVSGRADYVFVGLTREDAPLVRVRTATGNLYSLLLGH